MKGLAFAISLWLLLPRAATSADRDNVQAHWVELGANGQAIARVITTAARCPRIVIDGKPQRMSTRASAATIPRRSSTAPAADSKPSAFPVTTCETTIPGQAKHATVGTLALPLPKAIPQRIIVLGDTGCRMKSTANDWQNCYSSTAWPFARIAHIAATMHPDLVIHVGDYHYRESPCPASQQGCQNSPWGYGWDTWQADFFAPAQPLLTSAPWIMVRGNHEICQRAGQGWFRFLSSTPYLKTRSCDAASHDHEANYSAPYAVPLGDGAQIIVFDSANAGQQALDPHRVQDADAFANYHAEFEHVAKLANDFKGDSILVNHHPLLGLASNAQAIEGGNAALLSVLRTLFGASYFPAGVQLALHGHVHVFQAVSFDSNHPATIISGTGGTLTDRTLPSPLPAGVTPAAGVVIDKLADSNTFGFLVMDREPGGWTITAHRVDGSPLDICHLHGRKLQCDAWGTPH